MPELLENIEDEFRFNKDVDTSIDIDYGHGRIETIICSVINNFIHIEQPEKWVYLKYVVRIQSIREFKATGKIESATRYYITSLKQNLNSSNKCNF